jgi:hypothetical protein
VNTTLPTGIASSIQAAGIRDIRSQCHRWFPKQHFKLFARRWLEVPSRGVPHDAELFAGQERALSRVLVLMHSFVMTSVKLVARLAPNTERRLHPCLHFTFNVTAAAECTITVTLRPPDNFL